MEIILVSLFAIAITSQQRHMVQEPICIENWMPSLEILDLDHPKPEPIYIESERSCIDIPTEDSSSSSFGASELPIQIMVEEGPVSPIRHRHH